MKTLVVNCSAPYYNLGAHKLADWLLWDGHDVAYHDGDPALFGMGFERVCLSVIFSWHAPIAREIAMRLKGNAEIWCGGPGMTALAKWWKAETGLDSHRGLDARFDRQRGNYRMTFAARGCPVGCWFCIVPLIEGKTFTLDWDFTPASMLCDNNLSALPVEFQEHIIRRYLETETVLRDANSGFEPQTFDKGTYVRWQPILKGPWRFALDTTDELPQVGRMMGILFGESPRRKQVYVLIGNEPIAACYERTMKVIEWGGEPYSQPLLPLNALDRYGYSIRHDWTPQLLSDFTRWTNRHIWRSVPLREYSNRKNERPPFADLARL